MKSTKRVMALCLSAALILGIITGCSQDNGGANDTQDVGRNGEVREAVTITYAGWEDHLMALELAQKFHQRHSDINVEIINDGKWRGNEWVAQKAASGEMPDIINLENIVVPTQNGWLTDISPYFGTDEDASRLPRSMAKYGIVNDKLIMLPCNMYLYGVYLNKDLLAANDLEIPGYEWTIDEFVEIVKAATKKGSSIGANEVIPLMKHLQAQENPEVGWGNFNETTKKYELNADWEKTVQITKELMDANVSIYEDLDANGKLSDYEEGSAGRRKVEEKREAFLMELVGETAAEMAFYKGKTAAWMDFTWGSSFEDNPNYSGFDWDFYPFPSMTEGKGGRTPFVIDSLGITASCENPEAAYEFVKYLSFAEEGVEDRMEIVEEYDRDALMAKYPDVNAAEFDEPLNYNPMPVTTDKEVIARWAEFTNAKPGVRYLLERIGTGYADGYKVTPGFDEAYHQTIEKAVKEQVFTGQKTASELSGELMQKADEITQRAYDALK